MEARKEKGSMVLIAFERIQITVSINDLLVITQTGILQRQKHE